MVSQSPPSDGPESPAPPGEDIAPEKLEEMVWDQLKTCYDPEIPVNIVDLGLVYLCELEEADGAKNVKIKMTLTAPGCGMGPVIAEDARQKIAALPTDGLVALSTTQLSALSTAGVSALPTAVAAALSTSQIAALKPAQVAALATSTLAVLSTDQIDAISTTGVAASARTASRRSCIIRPALQSPAPSS